MEKKGGKTQTSRNRVKGVMHQREQCVPTLEPKKRKKYQNGCSTVQAMVEIEEMSSSTGEIYKDTFTLRRRGERTDIEERKKKR